MSTANRKQPDPPQSPSLERKKVKSSSIVKPFGKPSGKTVDRSSGKSSGRKCFTQWISALEAIDGKFSSPEISALIEAIKAKKMDYDILLNRLMSIYRDTRSVEIYTLIYKLSHKQFLAKIYYCLKRYHAKVDPFDILQDVFLSIYRYPRGFREKNKHSFRNWSTTIIRNAVFKQMNYREGAPSFCELEIDPHDKGRQRSPLSSMIRKEENQQFQMLYCWSLMIYQYIFNTTLQPREKTALHKVEVENLSYKDAASSMGIKLENFKMVVCRARKKIIRNVLNLGFGSTAPAKVAG